MAYRSTGPTGQIGSTGQNGVVGIAQYIQTVQFPNDSVPPGTAFSFDTTVFNNTSISSGSGSGGTVFTLPAGLYLIDYEMSLGSAGSVAIYKGPNSGSLAIDTQTVAGSSTATTWIHGRAIEFVSTTLVVAISSVVGTATVVTAGNNAGNFMIRITFLKLS